MIYKAIWRLDLNNWVLPWLANAHPNLSEIAARLEDFTNTDVWTQAPNDSTLYVKAFNSNLDHWRVFFRDQRTQLNSWNSLYGNLLLTHDSQMKQALDGFVSSIATLGGTFNTILNKYKDGSSNLIVTKISQADRTTVANAIRAELQP